MEVELEQWMEALEKRGMKEHEVHDITCWRRSVYAVGGKKGLTWSYSEARIRNDLIHSYVHVAGAISSISRQI